MKELSHIWRPAGHIRAKALGLPFQNGKLLAAAVHDDAGTLKGWRPLGGTIEFGERAEAALCREFREELDAEARILHHLGTFENIFTHHGQTGHEIIFAFEIAFTEPGRAAEDDFIVEDGAQRFRAAWVPVRAFHDTTETLLPDGLLPLVPTDRGA